MIFSPIGSEAKIRERVVLGVAKEGLHLEFKRALPEKGSEPLEEAARDVAQFCNTFGGTLIYGITEQYGEDGIPVAKEYASTPKNTKARLLDAVARHCRPSDLPIDVAEYSVDGAHLVVANVAPTERLVGVLRENWIQYPYRTSHGKNYFRPEEIEERMNSKKRAVVLALARVKNELGNSKDGPTSEIPSALVPSPLRADNHDLSDARSLPGTLMAGTFNAHDLTLTLRSTDTAGFSGAMVVVPYGLVADAWITTDRKLGLALDCRVVLRGGTLFLER